MVGRTNPKPLHPEEAEGVSSVMLCALLAIGAWNEMIASEVYSFYGP